MIRVLIVDDDVVTCTSLKTMIDWEKYGYEICGEATNGYNAIQLIDDSPPDIIITDMSMPVMDGIELIEHVKQKHPNIKIIALSGYDDFEYVRQSLKKGAIDYILKHALNPDMLLSILKAAYDDIIKDRREQAEWQQIQEQLCVGRTMLRQNFIKQLIAGALIERSVIEKTIQELGLELDTNNIVIADVEIDDFWVLKEKFTMQEMNVVVQSFLEITQAILKDSVKAFVSHIADGKFVILFSFGNTRSEAEIFYLLNTLVNQIKTSIKMQLNITASFSISQICPDITEIHKYYDNAEHMLKVKFFKGKDKIIRESLNEGNDESFLSLNIKDEKDIMMKLKSLDREGITRAIDNIFNRIFDSMAGYKSTQMICMELINIINKVARENGIEITLVYSNEDIPYDKLKKYETLSDIKQWIIHVYDKMIRLLELLQINAGYKEYTKQAVEFIHKNYKKDISLHDAAEYIGVNSAYLSRIFKEDTGKGFAEYLNIVRIERAKLLIQNGERNLKNIVREVGFNNYNYFFRVFKTMEGMTPQCFWKKCGSDIL